MVRICTPRLRASTDLDELGILTLRELPRDDPRRCPGEWVSLRNAVLPREVQSQEKPSAPVCRVGAIHQCICLYEIKKGGLQPPTPFKVFSSVVSRVGGQSQRGGSGSRSSSSAVASLGRVCSWGTS